MVSCAGFALYAGGSGWRRKRAEGRAEVDSSIAGPDALKSLGAASQLQKPRTGGLFDD